MLLALIACLCGTALAQTSGSISGEVRDEKQAVITGATVTMRNVSTNETRTAQTNADGRYHFAAVPVGSYEITVGEFRFRQTSTVGYHTGTKPERGSRRHDETRRSSGSRERRRKCVAAKYNNP